METVAKADGPAAAEDWSFRLIGAPEHAGVLHAELQRALQLVHPMANIAISTVVTTCPCPAAEMAPYGGIGAVGCTMITPITSNSNRPSVRASPGGDFDGLDIYPSYSGTRGCEDVSPRARHATAAGFRCD